ncbi:ATP-binding protein [Fusobacteria bacterium ZRK30]|nr:ATP-binding protein [Fusobacteria bacterium ZRK30]
MKIKKIILALIRAGFEKDIKAIESLSLSLLRLNKKEDPLLAEEIASILAQKKVGASSYRSIGFNSSPVDEGSQTALVQIREPISIIKPVFNENIEEEFQNFIKERKKISELLKYGIKPSNSIILYGEPGVGKTYSAKWLSYKLDMPLITLDLSATISSYLGKTGQNIKQVLEYAKSFNSILFLDEFDAIAKKRDDQSDIGELKRIVNILLKELEEWPADNIVIAATNHPEILDKAIWRRFDKHLELKNLDKKLTVDIIKKELELIKNINKEDLEMISYFVKNQSPANIVKLCDSIKRRYILSEEKDNFRKHIYTELKRNNYNGLKDKEICHYLKKIIPNITVKEIVKITGISQATIYRYLRED